jgi:hypothetical protein
MTSEIKGRVAELVQSFRRNEADHLRANYNETQARTDFITPLLEAFGWDVGEAYRATCSDIPVIYTSGRSNDVARNVSGGTRGRTPKAA